ncbi:MAG: AAA family ATPase, partial [Deltaproteobacteria bacterium]|nr:AAA family ATPase [Deltaproteobacteria bacterium]
LLDRIDEAPLFVKQDVGMLLDRTEREGADVAWVAVSRADPRELVEGGWLRRDLYFHLASLRITLPPLRERREDLPLLIDAIARDLGYPEFRLSPEEIAQLRAQPMEGNVRELRRIIEEALLRSPRGKGTPLTPDESAFAMTEEISRLPFKEAKERLLEAFERNYIAALLERAGGNLARAADEAGMDRSHFARLARKHGLR